MGNGSPEASRRSRNGRFSFLGTVPKIKKSNGFGYADQVKKRENPVKREGEIERSDRVGNGSPTLRRKQNTGNGMD